jgi:hypothetical protein
MRVAIITESFPPAVNGVAHCVLRVAELLSANGHQPLVIAPRPPRPKRDEKTSYPFHVVRVPAVPLPGYPGFRLGLPGRRVRAALIRHRAELHNLATLGALAADVERAQLPAATALRPDVASVVVGINDSGGPATWSRPWWAWPCANGSAPAAKRRNRNVRNRNIRKRRAGLEPVNLNVLSKPSGNLQLHECLPSARLKVRNRFSKRNGKT